MSWKVCSAMRRVSEHESGRIEYIMNEENKFLGKPRMLTEGTKKSLFHE